MSFAFFIIGAVLIITAVRGTTHDLGALVKSEFTGPQNFLFWIVALLVIGALGYIPRLKPVSIAFMTLVIIVLFLKRGNPSGIGGGFFNQFSAALNRTAATTTNQNLNQVLPDISHLFDHILPQF